MRLLRSIQLICNVCKVVSIWMACNPPVPSFANVYELQNLVGLLILIFLKRITTGYSAVCQLIIFLGVNEQLSAMT